MFGTIRKHQTWLWVVIIAVMILSLVVFFNPASDGSGRGGPADLGTVDGEKVTKNDYLNAQREATLAYFVMSGGAWPDRAGQRWDAERETYLRLFLNKKIKDHNIHVAEEAVGRAANQVLTRLGGGQRAVTLDELLQHLKERGFSEQDFARYLRHDLALQQLISVVSLPAELITPQEAREIYTRTHQEIAAHVLFYSGTNYQTSVPAATPELLQEFYTNRLGSYELPERVQLHYVVFPASNFLAAAEKELAAVTNLNAQIDQVLQQRGTNAFPDAKTPDEARQKIRSEFLTNQALQLAYVRAGEFLDPLLTVETVTAADFLNAGRTNNLPVLTTAPFDAQTGPAEISAGQNLATAAFRLTPQEPVFDRAVVGEEAVYAIALAKQLPREVQSYEVVKDRVAADYKRIKAAENARLAGSQFGPKVSAELKSGKSFSEITTAAGLKPIALPPFSMMTTNLPQLAGRVPLQQFVQTAFFTDPGAASEFVPTADGGYILFVDKRLPIDDAKLQADMPEFLENLRRSRREETINSWLNAEAGPALSDTPWMRRQQQQMQQPRS